MKLSEFEKLTYSDLEKLSTDQLKKLASEQGQKLNKRLDRISSSKETNKSAVRAVKESGGRFGVKGLTVKSRGGKVVESASRQNYIKEIRRQQNFQKAKTGTVKGAKKVQEESGKKVYITSGKDYEKERARQWRQEQKEKIGKKKWSQMSKKQKSKFYQESRKFGKLARKNEYDKRISNYWEVYHRFKEEHPAQLEIGAMSQYYAPDVKRLAMRVATGEIESTKDEVDKELQGILRRAKKDDVKADVWETVDRNNPFDSKETPEQFTLRNGRIV